MVKITYCLYLLVLSTLVNAMEKDEQIWLKRLNDSYPYSHENICVSLRIFKQAKSSASNFENYTAQNPYNIYVDETVSNSTVTNFFKLYTLLAQPATIHRSNLTSMFDYLTIANDNGFAPADYALACAFISLLRTSDYGARCSYAQQITDHAKTYAQILDKSLVMIKQMIAWQPLTSIFFIPVLNSFIVLRTSFVYEKYFIKNGSLSW